MRYRSTTSTETVTFREAVLRGTARKRGLYVPCELPRLSPPILKALPSLHRHEIAQEVTRLFVGDDPSKEALRAVLESSMTFDAPVIALDHSTAAIEHFQRSENRPLTVLVATSGDTGGAVGSGFAGRQGIKVVILYPRGQVSPLQEKQLTTIGGNVTVVRVNGTFDDCQALVKSTFEDSVVREKLPLTSANSINIARLIPQTYYYFWAVASWFTMQPLVISVPSGNYGNLTAGLYARPIGLPIARFIAATNANDIVRQYLRTGIFKSAPSISTIANAMDVGNPSNIVRMIDLFGGDVESMKAAIAHGSYRNDEIRAGIREVCAKFDYVVDPHGAIRYLALRDDLRSHPEHFGIFSSTPSCNRCHRPA